MEELTSMGIISIIPAILAIVLSFATKNTIVALAVACIAGTTMSDIVMGDSLVDTLLLGFPIPFLFPYKSIFGKRFRFVTLKMAANKTVSTINFLLFLLLSVILNTPC